MEMSQSTNMEFGDFDMLEFATQHSQEEIAFYDQSVQPDRHLEDDIFASPPMSSSPMSVSGNYLQVDLSNTAEHGADRDSTSCVPHRYGTAPTHGHFLARFVDDNEITSPAQTTNNYAGVIGSDYTQSQVIIQIESVFESIADSLLADREDLSITLTAHHVVHNTGTRGHQEDVRLRNVTVTFPGKSPEEAWKFTVILRLLELIHEALRSGNTVTKRDIYYRDPALFGKQSVVDRCVDQIAVAFGVARSCMGINAAAKGLITGAAELYRKDGTRLDLVGVHENTLIPNIEDILAIAMEAVEWILVVEKEATYQSIATSDEWESLRWQGILMTGKGYPDIATRAMLRFITRSRPQNGFAAPVVYGLMDYDPDGLAIFNTYKHGSVKLKNESDSLAVPEMQWLGLNDSHITDEDQTHRNQGLMPLTKRDRHKARKMLEQDSATEGTESRRQLQVMLMLNLKAELQILDAKAGALMRLIKFAVQ